MSGAWFSGSSESSVKYMVRSSFLGCERGRFLSPRGFEQRSILFPQDRRDEAENSQGGDQGGQHKRQRKRGGVLRTQTLHLLPMLPCGGRKCEHAQSHHDQAIGAWTDELLGVLLWLLLAQVEKELVEREAERD